MKLLIVVDVQHDFVDGVLGTLDAQAIVPNVVEKVKSYEHWGYPILYTRDTHFADNYMDTQEGKLLPVPHCLHGTDGWKIIPEAYTPNYSYLLDKPSFGYLEIVGAIERIQSNRDELIDAIEIIGLCTDICVVSNALILKAAFPETFISCDSSCCAGTCNAAHEAALKTMTSCQIHVY